MPGRRLSGSTMCRCMLACSPNWILSAVENPTGRPSSSQTSWNELRSGRSLAWVELEVAPPAVRLGEVAGVDAEGVEVLGRRVVEGPAAVEVTDPRVRRHRMGDPRLQQLARGRSSRTRWPQVTCLPGCEDVIVLIDDPL